MDNSRLRHNKVVHEFIISYIIPHMDDCESIVAEIQGCCGCGGQF